MAYLIKNREGKEMEKTDEQIKEIVLSYENGNIKQMKEHLNSCSKIELIKTIMIWEYELSIAYGIILSKVVDYFE